MLTPLSCVARTVISYNLAITTLGAKGFQWSMALQCFDDLCLQRLSPDAISYNALITACNMATTLVSDLTSEGRKQEQQLLVDYVTPLVL